MNKIYLHNIIDLLWSLKGNPSLKNDETITIYDEDNKRDVIITKKENKVIFTFEEVKKDD